MRFDINEKRKYQTVEGFGASGAWWAQIVGNWTHEDPVSGKPVRDRISELLFSKTEGIGLNIYREAQRTRHVQPTRKSDGVL